MHFTSTLYFFILTIILAIVALATSGWGKCGNIVVDCKGHTKGEKLLYLTAKSLMLVGTGLLVLAIIMEIVSCCTEDGKSSVHSRSFAICRSVSAVLALFTLLAGMLIVTHLIGDVFSYMAMVMAVGFAIHCNTLLIQKANCSRSSSTEKH